LGGAFFFGQFYNVPKVIKPIRLLKENMVINKKMKIKKQTNILVDYLLTTRKKFGDYKT
jgi:hypothetical protein